MRQVNPISIRLGLNKKWNSIWYASNKEYTEMLLEDFFLKNYTKQILMKKHKIIIRIFKEKLKKQKKKIFYFNHRISRLSYNMPILVSKKNKNKKYLNYENKCLRTFKKRLKKHHKYVKKHSLNTFIFRNNSAINIVSTLYSPKNFTIIQKRKRFFLKKKKNFLYNNLNLDNVENLLQIYKIFSKFLIKNRLEEKKHRESFILKIRNIYNNNILMKKKIFEKFALFIKEKSVDVGAKKENKLVKKPLAAIAEHKFSKEPSYSITKNLGIKDNCSYYSKGFFKNTITNEKKEKKELNLYISRLTFHINKFKNE
jgi:hypothetical protein